MLLRWSLTMLVACGLLACKPAEPVPSGSQPAAAEGAPSMGGAETGPGTGVGVPKMAQNARGVMILADGFNTPFRNYQVQMLAGLVRTRAGFEVDAVEAFGDEGRQAAQVRQAVDAGAKVLMVFPLLSDGVIEALREACAKGVKVVVFRDDLPTDAYTSAIGVDEREIGKVAGGLVVEALTRKAKDDGFTEVRGRVVQLRGSESSEASKQIAEGFSEVLQKVPGIKVVHDAPGNWSDEIAGLRMREALRLQQPFDVVFAHNDLMAAGVVKVAKETGVRESLLVIGVDGAPGTQGGMDRVRREELEATVYRPPLVDVAWGFLVKWSKDEAVTWPKKTRVKPFLMTQEEAAKHTGRGLPVPVLE